MARFEFGKGKKKTYWDVEQLGRVVRTQDTEPHCTRLSGYRTFPDEPTAQREIGRLVSEHLAKGFVPADDAARNLAATAPPPPPKKRAAPTLPVRRDLDIYNEANGFMVLSMKMAGVALEEGSAKWNKAVADAKMIPVMLFQDDPFTVRVVAGDKLTPQESEEWVARVDWWLNIPDGKLAVTGGAVLVNDEYDEDDPYYEDYIGVVEVPPGFYRATIYTYIPGVNGSAVLDHLAGGYEKGERLGKWFRRTRPGETFPAWLRDLCVAIPSTDPDHKAEWKTEKHPSDPETSEYIGFLVHLEPAAREDKSGKPAIEEGQGWFGDAEGGRKPERCPLGLEGRDVVQSKEREVPAGNWIYVEDVYQRIRPFESVPIGGPLEVELSVLPELSRLAWFTVFQSVPEIRMTLPPKGVFNLPTNWPAESVAREEDGVWRISFSNNLRPVQMIPVIAKVAEHLAALPEGTEMEFVSSQLNAEALHGRTPVGSHRYGGQIVNGKWRLKETFPKVDAATLREALALCAEATAGDAITLKDGEVDAVMKWAKGNHGPWIEDNPGTIKNDQLTLGKRDPAVLNLYAASVFAVRFAKAWPVLNLAEGDEEDEEGDDDKPINNGIPVQGKKILETPGGRMYFATMALLMSEKIAAVIQKEERALQRLGFKYVGDLVCNLFPKIAVRGYAQKDGDTWASYLVAYPDTLVFEMSTRFEKDGASLLTTRKPDAQDDLVKHSYRQSVSDADFAVLQQRHDARKQELAARYGAPIQVELTLASLAQAIESALKKQLGG